MNTRDLVVVSLAAALSTALNLLRPITLPQGGSITLDMLPIFYVAFWRGPARGIMAGFLAGIIQFLIRPIFVHPIQMVLDYPLAMAAPGIAGLIWRVGEEGRLWIFSVALGVLVGGGAKFALHFFSGVVFFAAYAPAGQSVWVYSALYNASYIVPQTALALVILPPLLRRIRAVRPADGA